MKKFYLIFFGFLYITLFHTENLLACPVPGTYTIGPTGNYLSITSAVADLSTCGGTISGSYIFELQSTYVSTVETFPINIPDLGASATNTITFRPKTGATGLVITSSNDSGTIKLNGAKYVFIDGRPGGTGTAKQLTIQNTNTFLYTSAAGATSSGTTVTVSSTTGLAVGMLVGVGPGSGFFGPNITITNILSSTQFQVSGTPTSQLTVATSSTVTAGWTPSAIIFVNGASSNTVKYCNIRSANQNITSGTVFFSTAVGTVGNNNNCIAYNDIFDASAGFPLIGVYGEAFSTSGQFNSGDTITYNNIYNYYKTGASSAGVLLRCSSNSEVSYNSFYQTGSRNLGSNSVQSTGINITGIIIPGSLVSSTNLGINNLIKNNYVGGNTSNAGGSAMTITGAGAFVGIGIWAGTSVKTTVSGNTIQNLSYTSSGSGVSPRAIAVFTGTVDCINNNIGSQSIANSIQLNVNGTTSNTVASMINAGAGAPTTGTITISNNTIGGILVNSTSTVPTFRGISFQGSPSGFLIDGNLINTVASTSNMALRGIWSSSTSASNVISNNTITNISQTSTGTSGQAEGVFTQGVGSFTISGNQINNLSSASNYTGNPAVVGIEIASTGTSNVIEQNVMYALSANNSNANAVNVSAFYSTSASGGQFIKNKIYDLTNLHPSTTGYICGIYLLGGPWTVANNMISVTNSSNTNATQVMGILDNAGSSGARNYFYNSIYIGGTGTNDTYGAALQYNCGSGTANIKNNILVNERSTGGGSAKFYAIANKTNNNTGLSSNNNILNCSTAATIGLLNTTDQLFTDWQTNTGGDANSFSAEYVPFTNTSTGDLHINTSDATLIAAAYVSNIESKGAVVSTTVDYDNDARPGPAGSVRGGASSPDIGADETDLTNRVNVWTGVDNDWNNPANWSTGLVPSSGSDINIPAGLSYYPDLTTTVSVKNLSIAAGAQFNIGTTGTMNISGVFTNTGTLSNSGEIILNGTSQQSFPGTTGTIAAMNNLTVNNAAGVILNRSFSITGTLTPTSGNIDLDNVFITLTSDASKTARLGQVTGGSLSYTGTGNFIVQRYLPAKRAWRLMAAPLKPGGGTHTIGEAWQERSTGLDFSSSAATVTSLATDTISAGFATQITGGTTANGFDQSANNNSSIKYYGSGAWLTPANTNSLSVNSQEGWMLFVRGDRRNFGQITTQYKPATITTLRPRGQLFTGTKTITSSGMTVVGNPYASALDFHTATKTGDLTDEYYMWDPQLGGTFGVGSFVALSWNGTDYTRSPSSTIDNRYIPSGAAIMVDFGTGGTLTFHESDKSAANTTLAFRHARNLRTDLISVEPDGNNFLSDGAVVLLDKKFNNAVDTEDAMKITNFSESFSIRRDGKLLSIEKRKLPETTDTVFFNWGLMKLRNYQLQFLSDSLQNEWVEATLEDNYKKIAVPLNLSDTAKYDFSLISDPASYPVTRFDVLLKYNPPVLNNFAVKQQNENISVQWTVANEREVGQYIIERSSDGENFVEAGSMDPTVSESKDEKLYQWVDVKPGPGLYNYRVVCVSKGGSNTVKTGLATIKLMKFDPQMYVTPNPVQGTEIHLQMNALAGGKYTIRLINNAGQVIYSGIVFHTEGTATELIRLPQRPAKGVYKLEVKSPLNKTTILPLLSE